MRGYGTCQNCHAHGNMEKQESGLVVCVSCGEVSEKYTVTRTEASFNTMEVHFSPMYNDFNAAGENLSMRGIVGMLKIDCDEMPDGLRTEVEDWVREMVKKQGIEK